MSHLPDKRVGLDDLASAIPNGSLLAIPADYGGPAIAATLALLRRGIRDLRLVTELYPNFVQRFLKAAQVHA